MEFETESLTASAIYLVVFEFVIVIAFIFFSRPFAEIIGVFLRIGSAEVVSFVPTVQFYFQIMFGVAGIIPIVWFILWIFRTEPDWNFRRFM